MPRTIDLIVIHCSATPNGDALFRGVSGAADFKTAADVIDEMHRARGFKRTGPSAIKTNPRLQSIGYHFVIACNGAVFTGRALDEVGAHAQGYNANSIGICLTGTSAYTVEQWASLEAVLRQLNQVVRVPLHAPMRKRRTDGSVAVFGGVCGHRDLSPDLNQDGRVTSNEWVKTCPGFDVATYLNDFVPPKAALLLQGGAHA